MRRQILAAAKSGAYFPVVDPRFPMDSRENRPGKLWSVRWKPWMFPWIFPWGGPVDFTNPEWQLASKHKKTESPQHSLRLLYFKTWYKIIILFSDVNTYKPSYGFLSFCWLVESWMLILQYQKLALNIHSVCVYVYDVYIYIHYIDIYIYTLYIYISI